MGSPSPSLKRGRTLSPLQGRAFRPWGVLPISHRDATDPRAARDQEQARRERTRPRQPRNRPQQEETPRERPRQRRPRSWPGSPQLRPPLQRPQLGQPRPRRIPPASISRPPPSPRRPLCASPPPRQPLLPPLRRPPRSRTWSLHPCWPSPPSPRCWVHPHACALDHPPRPATRPANVRRPRRRRRPPRPPLLPRNRAPGQPRPPPLNQPSRHHLRNPRLRHLPPRPPPQPRGQSETSSTPCQPPPLRRPPQLLQPIRL